MEIEKSIMIVPDVHGRSFWHEAFEEYGDRVEQTVFLGDYVDPYPEEGFTRRNANEELDRVIAAKKANPEKVTLLLGNHDCHYLYPKFIRSSRYSSSHAWHIYSKLSENQNLFQLAYDKVIGEKRYLFTHAGVLKSWYRFHKDIIGEELTAEAINRLNDGKYMATCLSDVSAMRGGWDASGSPLWADVMERMSNYNEDIEGIYQIFGHTRTTGEPIVESTWALLDCSKVFFLDEEGKVST